jgi:DNA-binding Lrp family transcriptional regulator
VQDLCADPRVVTVEESTQGYDLILTVMTSDMVQMSTFVLDALGTLPAVAGRRTYLATPVHRDGSSWCLDALDKYQVRSFETAARSPRASTGMRPLANAWPLIQALAADGRRTAAEVAEITGRNPATVRRQLPQLLASDLVSIRCEIAQSASRHPISCTWRGRIAAADEPRTVTALGTLPNLRPCMSTIGDTNLLITVWSPTSPMSSRSNDCSARNSPGYSYARPASTCGHPNESAGCSTNTATPPGRSSRQQPCNTPDYYDSALQPPPKTPP